MISVKGGANINPGMVRDLKGTREREGADLALFLSLEEPTAEMQREAAATGTLDLGALVVPRVQLFTVGSLLATPTRTVPAPLYTTVTAADAARHQASRSRKSRRPDPKQREMYFPMPDALLSAGGMAEDVASLDPDLRREAGGLPSYLRVRTRTG